MRIQIYNGYLTFVTGSLGMTRTISIPEELKQAVKTIETYCFNQRTPEQVAVDEAEEQIDQLQEELVAAATLIAENRILLEALMIEFPVWVVDIDYEEGDIISYEDQLYKVLSAHTSQETWNPDLTPSLYRNITNVIDPNLPLEWIQPQGAHDTYNMGDRVFYNGKIWTSTVNSNNWEPGVYGWEEEMFLSHN